MIRGRRTIIGSTLVVCGALLFCTLAAGAEARRVWEEVRGNWDLYERNAFVADVLFYARRTETFMQNHPLCEAEVKAGEDWRFRVIELTYVNPGRFFMVYRKSLNEQGLAGAVLQRPGVRMVYGVRDTSQLYIKLPLTGNAYADKFAEGNVYTADADSNFCDLRKIFYSLYMKPRFLDLLEHYFEDGAVTVEARSVFLIEDYEAADMEKGLAAPRPGVEPRRPALVMVLTPVSPDANKGVVREEIFVDPEQMIPIGFAQYEADGLVNLLLIENLEYDPDIPEELFEYFFRDVRLSEKKDEDRVACPCLFY